MELLWQSKDSHNNEDLDYEEYYNFCKLGANRNEADENRCRCASEEQTAEAKLLCEKLADIGGVLLTERNNGSYSIDNINVGDYLSSLTKDISRNIGLTLSGDNIIVTDRSFDPDERFIYQREEPKRIIRGGSLDEEFIKHFYRKSFSMSDEERMSAFYNILRSLPCNVEIISACCEVARDRKVKNFSKSREVNKEERE